MYRPKIIHALRGYSAAQFSRDAAAGVIVGIIALPLSIALAISSGVSPEAGLITAIVAGFCISAFGGSHVQIGGPTGAFVVIVYGIIAQHGLSGLLTATLMAGCIMILMGLFRMGALVRHVPYAVTAGFTSGIAVTIFSTQVKDLLGLKMAHVPSAFFEKWGAYFGALSTAAAPVLLLSAVSLAILIFWPKVSRRIPGSLVAILAATGLALAFFPDVPTIGAAYGEISSALPQAALPALSPELCLLVLPSAVTIALLASIESLLSAVVADKMTDTQTDPNAELIGQGIANIAVSLVGGLPATGAIARTAANVKNGGRTPIAGIVHAATLLIIFLVCMPLAAYVPLCALAAVLAGVSYQMGEWSAFPDLWRKSKFEFTLMLTTFLLTVCIDLVAAICVGMALYLGKILAGKFAANCGFARTSD